MKKNSILKTTLLDIVFEGRNKEYGAYELRSHYNSRLTKSMGITLGLGFIVVLSSFFSRVKPEYVKQVEIPDIVTLREVDPVEPPPVIPPPKEIEPPVATTSFTTPPQIVEDNDVKPEEMPPEMDQLLDTKISTQTNPGEEFDGSIAPPLETGGVVEPPKGKAEDSVFLKVEIDAEFPGGNAGWNKYVTREIERNIDELTDDGRSGTVLVMFIVDKEGNVSEVRANPCENAGVPNCLGGETKLAEIAVNAIRKGPKWKPAIQNHQHVKAYRRQLVTFQISEE